MITKIYTLIPRDAKKCLGVEKYVPAIKLLSKHYGVKVRFFSREQVMGYYNIPKSTIHIKTSQCGMLSSFFHELGHHHCCENGIWTGYHIEDFNSDQDLKRYLRVALRAERWVDHWAKKEMGKWFPKMLYGAGYFDPENVKWFKEVYLKSISDGYKLRYVKLT